MPWFRNRNSALTAPNNRPISQRISSSGWTSPADVIAIRQAQSNTIGTKLVEEWRESELGIVIYLFIEVKLYSDRSQHAHLLKKVWLCDVLLLFYPKIGERTWLDALSPKWQRTAGNVTTELPRTILIKGRLNSQSIDDGETVDECEWKLTACNNTNWRRRNTTPLFYGPALILSLYLLLWHPGTSIMSDVSSWQYRMTIQVVTNLPLPPKQMLCFSISSSY